MTLEELQVILSKADEEQKNGNLNSSNSLIETIIHDSQIINSSIRDIQQKYIEALLLYGWNKKIEGNIEIALNSTFEGVRLSTHHNFSVLLAHSNMNLGSIYKEMSESISALEYYGKALTIYEEIGDKKGIGSVANNLGMVYQIVSDFEKSIEFYSKSLFIFEEIGNKLFQAKTINNIGIVYSSVCDFEKALEMHGRAILLFEEIGDKGGITSATMNLGIVYISLSDNDNALVYFFKALSLQKEIGNKLGLANTLGNIGAVYFNLNENVKALEYYSNSLTYFQEIRNKLGTANQLNNIGTVYCKLKEYEKAMEYYSKALEISKEIGNKRGISMTLGNMIMLYSENESIFYNVTKTENLAKEVLGIAEEIGFKEVIKEVYHQMHNLRLQEGFFKEALEYYKKSIEISNEIQTEELSKKAALFDQKRKMEEDEKARQLKLARFQEQEKLLNNILPSSIAERILQQETFIADHHQSVSVMFLDLVGFTPLSSLAPPKQLVYLLDAIFTKADEIVERFGLEKIKTIGDGYMAVANVTTSLENHQQACANAAAEIIDVLKGFVVSIPEELGDSSWIVLMNPIEIRIGLHTGEVVAGIIGKNKYTFDLWGDAVNIASRMESHSEPWKIHISEEFAKSLEQYQDFKVISRGEISIKGKGTMKTFWLEKPE